MKKLIVFLTAIIFLVACKSSSKQLETGNYDAALQKSAKKIKKNPVDFEEVTVFNNAYRLAYAKDETEVNRLKSMGNPANWRRIYTIYLRMNKRQNLAASLPSAGVNYQKRDFNDEIVAAKDNATAYAYDQGILLLAKNDRFEARQAYDFFGEVQRYNPSYKDINDQLKIAKLKGTTNAFYRVENNTGLRLTKYMLTDLQNIDLDHLDEKWKNFDSYIDTNIIYNYSIVLSLEMIEISADQLEETAAIETKKINDGFDYVLDINGNVTKDTLGNDVKVIKYKTISCNVQRFIQTKTIHIAGNITYIDNATNQTLKKEYVEANAAFAHYYATASGDINALSPKTIEEIKVLGKPFPTDEQFLMQTGIILKEITSDFITNNQELIN